MTQSSQARSRRGYWMFLCIISNGLWLLYELDTSQLLPSPSSIQRSIITSHNWDQTANAIVIVPTSFTIRANKTFSYYQGGSYLELFHSFVPFNDGYQVVYNYRSKSEASTTDRGSTFIETVHVSSTLEREDETQRRIGIKQQSDPRAFGWNSSVYCLTWKANWRGRRGKDRVDSLDFDNSLINLITGEQNSLDHCVGGYRGKNWIPLVYQDTLYVVHRLSPKLKWFTYDAQNGCPQPTVEEGTEIDQWRGGSPFVPLGSNAMISVGHQTIDGDTHIPFMMHVDMTTNITTKIEMSTADKSNLSGILDPTSLWWEEIDGKKKLYMGTIHTAGRWKNKYFNDQYVFNNSIYEVELVYDTHALL